MTTSSTFSRLIRITASVAAVIVFLAAVDGISAGISVALAAMSGHSQGKPSPVTYKPMNYK